METVRMVKSRPRKNRSNRSDLPCHIITKRYFFQAKDDDARFSKVREHLGRFTSNNMWNLLKILHDRFVCLCSLVQVFIEL